MNNTELINEVAELMSSEFGDGELNTVLAGKIVSLSNENIDYDIEEINGNDSYVLMLEDKLIKQKIALKALRNACNNLVGQLSVANAPRESKKTRAYIETEYGVEL